MQQEFFGFHPIVRTWFLRRFGSPTEAQVQGWPLLCKNQNTLLAAPTGSGKTLAAFLVFIDRLVKQAIEGTLEEGVQIVYVSPLKALSHDVQKNLEVPLAEIQEEARAQGLHLPPLRVAVRTGDSTSAERARILKQPPHILVTTPESLYLLLTAEKSRGILKSTCTVIVDEIHALARDKRGSHMSITLERLEHLCERTLVRIGLSATQKPLERMAEFLTGTVHRDCTVLNLGSLRHFDLGVETPKSTLSAVCSQEMWEEIYENLCQLINTHQSTLIFVNTRRMAERVGAQLTELLGEEAVASHHGSLSRSIRLDVEDRLKRGKLKAIVATASLELGIDIGFVDLVCQIGSPRSIATFIQRVGRSGHTRHGLPKGRLFALTRDELLECYALVKATRSGILDSIEIPERPIDILAQQIVAIVANPPALHETWTEDALFELIGKAWPYRNLSRDEFTKVLGFLAEGLSERTRRGTYIHWDKVHKTVRPRRSARLSAITSGGAIPEQNLYRVVTADTETFVGTLEEEFSVESSRGDIFTLGNTSWQIDAVRDGKVFVHDAGGALATIPFWLGEAPGRTYELSTEVGLLREEIERFVIAEDREGGIQWLMEHCLATHQGAAQAYEFIAAQHNATGHIPSHRKVVFERFFDETGGMQLVVHAPFGGRINRAWGLAFRKRFCRGFDFELQAIADDNGMVLSVGPNQSFPLEAMTKLLGTDQAEELLVQALLAAPMFQIRWRWNVTRALAVLRSKSGKRVPPHLQRYQAEDLLTAVFPAQTQCFEHRTGDLEVPDHPLVQQTVRDCLTEAMDITRFLDLCRARDEGSVDVVCIDTREPSPFSHALLNSNPYTFLDGAPLEERRTRAVTMRRWQNAEEWNDLSALDPQIISQVSQEAWPVVRDADELYDALRQMVIAPLADIQLWPEAWQDLQEAERVGVFTNEKTSFVVAIEDIPYAEILYPHATWTTKPDLPEALRFQSHEEEAAQRAVRGHLECRGPITAAWLASHLKLATSVVDAALIGLETQGLVLSGHFTAPSHQNAAAGGDEGKEWCERRLLARIHRLTLDGLRQQIKPVSRSLFWRFLTEHQHATEQTRWAGQDGVLSVLEQLMGFEAPLGIWENELLPNRLQNYQDSQLDQWAMSGQLAWGRLTVPEQKEDSTSNGIHRSTSIAIIPREHLAWLLPPAEEKEPPLLSSNAEAVYTALRERGAQHFHELKAHTKILPTQIEEGLSELVALGMVSSDSFAAMRPVASPSRSTRWSPHTHSRAAVRSGGAGLNSPYAHGGRWYLFPGPLEPVSPEERAENWARLLLQRYGVIFRDLLTRESLAPKWFELVSVYRRLEMRGEVRGGRFVEGVAGEQFALPEAVTTLRELARSNASSGWCVIAAADPLNLEGVLNDEHKITANRTNRLILKDGELIAARVGGACHFYKEVDVRDKEMYERAIRMSGRVRGFDPFLQDWKAGRKTAEPRGGIKNWRNALKNVPHS